MFTRPKPRTLKRSLLIATTNAVVATACFGGAFLIAPQADVTSPIEGRPSIVEPAPTADPVAPLIASGECWTGGDNHPYPSRVWLNTPDGPVLKGQRVVDRLLTDWDLDDVAAFCK